MSSIWICCICEEEIPRNVVIYRFHCRLCARIFHAKCLDLSREEYFDIKRKTGVNWLCSDCIDSNDTADGSYSTGNKKYLMFFLA